MDSNTWSHDEFLVHAEEEMIRSVNNSGAATYYSSLHGVRKLAGKQIMKKPIAPLPPIKPRMYKVEPCKFKEVVQRLTAAPEFQRRRLEEMAPPALDLITTNKRVCVQQSAVTDHNNMGAAAGLGQAQQHNIISTSPGMKLAAAPVASGIAVERKIHKFSETCGALSPLGFSFSPSGMAWPFSPLLSPGTLSSLEQSTVL